MLNAMLGESFCHYMQYQHYLRKTVIQFNLIHLFCSNKNNNEANM